jgi:hypothetical protein
MPRYDGRIRETLIQTLQLITTGTHVKALACGRRQINSVSCRNRHGKLPLNEAWIIWQKAEPYL